MNNSIKNNKLLIFLIIVATILLITLILYITNTYSKKENYINETKQLYNINDKNIISDFKINNKQYNIKIENNNIILNNKNIKTINSNEIILNLYLLKDILVYEIKKEDLTIEMNFIKPNGDLIKTINTFGKDNLLIIDSDINTTISDNTITFDTSLKSFDSLNQFTTMSDDAIVKATYELIYLGNYKFSELNIINSLTYKEFKEI